MQWIVHERYIRFFHYLKRQNEIRGFSESPSSKSCLTSNQDVQFCFTVSDIERTYAFRVFLTFKTRFLLSEFVSATLCEKKIQRGYWLEKKRTFSLTCHVAGFLDSRWIRVFNLSEKRRSTLLTWISKLAYTLTVLHDRTLGKILVGH